MARRRRFFFRSDARKYPLLYYEREHFSFYEMRLCIPTILGKRYIEVSYSGGVFSVASQKQPNSHQYLNTGILTGETFYLISQKGDLAIGNRAKLG